MEIQSVNYGCKKFYDIGPWPILASMYAAYLGYPVVEDSTHNPMIQGLNPANTIGIEKIAQKYRVFTIKNITD